MTTARELYFSATIITLDGSDTNAYGEGCEPGKGYIEPSGWWQPDRSYWRVHAERDDVTADVYPGGEDRDPARWLADRLVARLATVESYDGWTFYGAFEAVHPGRLTDLAAHPSPENPGAAHALAFIRRGVARTGQRFLTAAGHAHGFTNGDVTEAAQLLGLLPDLTTHPSPHPCVHPASGSRRQRRGPTPGYGGGPAPPAPVPEARARCQGAAQKGEPHHASCQPRATAAPVRRAPVPDPDGLVTAMPTTIRNESALGIYAFAWTSATGTRCELCWYEGLDAPSFSF